MRKREKYNPKPIVFYPPDSQREFLEKFAEEKKLKNLQAATIECVRQVQLTKEAAAGK
ncbi:MAG: hypothetical protein AB1757_21395 [Acidobacteriota bacterium]